MIAARSTDQDCHDSGGDNSMIAPMRMPVFFTLFVTVTGLVASCIQDPDPPGPTGHGCYLVQFNSLWSMLSLKLHHTDSRTCPQDAEIGAIVDGGGRIEDMGETWPQDSGSENSLWVDLIVTNSVDYCNTDPPTGAQVGSANQIFSWSDFDNDQTPEWNAQVIAAFQARTGTDSMRDCPEFHVTLFDPYNQKASAWTMISYGPEM